jgi:hypothetical protein
MTLKKDCKHVKIIDIGEEVKLLIQYDQNQRPILIQYCDDKKKEGYEFKKI